MSERKERADILGLANFGIFLILVGLIVATTPNLIDRFADFFLNFQLQEVAHNVLLPAPTSLDHPVVFGAVYQFCLMFGLLQIPMVVARVIMKDTARRTASTATGVVFWLGVAWLVSLIITITWLNFVGYIIALVGIAIMVENVIVLMTRRRD
ncbi:MAG: hypothetical protein FJZ49_00190 [Candidatus Verstraetearchaeota archaeon]|nr:hypothetical protein [Candidatus Verstraetearchaeota archaeon]